MHYYSFAGEARGKSDPVDVYCIDVEGGDCDVPGCVQSGCEHTVIMWSGNEYSKDHTWIACDQKYTVNLQETR